MNTSGMRSALSGLFKELTEGPHRPGEAYILNTGDLGMLRSLDKLSAADASQSANGGATIAAHARHVAYGVSLMNQWARAGDNPFANARWDEAWKTTAVNDAEWQSIRSELRDAAREWLDVLSTPREVADVELNGMIGSIAHLAYHLGAIRQIAKTARGPREGTFA